MNLSTADLRNYRTEFHETWWSYWYMFLVDPKVFRFVVKESMPYCWGFKGGGGSPHFYGVFLQPFCKRQRFWKFWKRRTCPLLGTYHYVQIFFSYIFQLEVININVRNFKIILILLLSFHAPWTCPRQISGTTGQNFMKLGGVIDICF
jgi:hypothetical protein